MNKVFFLFLIVTTSIFSQKFYVIKRDYTDPENYIHSILEIDQSDGTTLDSFDYQTSFPNSNSPESLTFNDQTKEIVGISENKIVKYNVETQNEISFDLPVLSSGDYRDIIVADTKLYLIRRDYSDPENYIHSILEVDLNDGSILNSFDYQTNFPNSYSPESLTFNNQTKEIIGISENKIVKYNVETQNETSFDLPVLSSGDYRDIIIADAQLYVIRRDYSDPENYIHSILELDQNDGSITDSFDYQTSFPESYSPESLTFNDQSKEIIGISENKIVKYNIETQNETSFNLPALSSGDYRDIISTEINVLSVSDLENYLINDAKIVATYNLLGQKIKQNTENQIIIRKYDNGSYKKEYFKK